jgi:DNA-binding NarL/FixJ family response regulator
MIRIAIFDDDKAIADSLRLLFADSDDCLLVGTYPNALRAVDRVAQCRPDVVIMDIKMPDVSGIEATGAIKAAFPTIQILMQTVFEDDHKVFAAICAGASGYMLKGTPPDKLLDAIADVYMGGTPFSPGVGRKVLRFFQEQQTARPEFFNLSKREREILTLLTDGLSYKLIADACGISFNTVNAHLRNIYDKLHVNSSQEAISKALRQRLV